MEASAAMDTGQPPPRLPPPLMPPPPAKYTLGIADAVLFCSPEDEEAAEDFQKKVIEMMRDVCPVVIHMHTDLAHQGSELRCVGEICKLAATHWFYVTENSIKDPKVQLYKDEQIMKSISGTGSFIPIWSKPKNQFTSLPYGMSAYSGIYEDDPRLKLHLKRMFSTTHHQSSKVNLKRQQDEAKMRWEDEQKAILEEKEKMYKKDQEVRRAKKRAAVQNMLPSGEAVPESDEDLNLLFHELKIKRETSSPPLPPRQNSSPDGAMPEYLLSSLDSARSSTRSSPRSSAQITYNTTINQPKIVHIGGGGGGGGDGHGGGVQTEDTGVV